MSKPEDRRVFCFRFKMEDRLHQQAREILEQMEDEYREVHQTTKSGLADIITELVLASEGKKVPQPSERRMMQILSNQMQSVLGVLEELKNRSPEHFYGAVNNAHQDGDIDDDMYNSLLGDFNNTDGR